MGYQSSTTNEGTGNSATVNKPSGTVQNDVLVASVNFEKGSDNSVTPPSGWTLIRRTNNGTDVGMATYYKVAGASEPSSYTWTHNQSPKWAAGIGRYDGVDTADPLDVDSGNTGNSSSQTANSVTTTADNAIVLCAYTHKSSGTYTVSYTHLTLPTILLV